MGDCVGLVPALLPSMTDALAPYDIGGGDAARDAVRDEARDDDGGKSRAAGCGAIPAEASGPISAAGKAAASAARNADAVPVLALRCDNAVGDMRPDMMLALRTDALSSPATAAGPAGRNVLMPVSLALSSSP
jgi:hypothetical protein